VGGAILASMAQEESRSISQNVTIGKRWGMKEGRVSWAYSNMLGYKKENGKIVVVENEAFLVRQIYQLFLRGGKTCTGIAEFLKAQGIPTPSGKSYKWTKNTINSILRNEKYKGDALLQKTYTTDYLEHKVEKNRGHLPQYYVENSHPAIIDPNEWDLVQVEFARRDKLGMTYSSKNTFSSKLVCAECGGFYGQKVWHSNTKYRRTIWHCNKKFDKDKDNCSTPTLTEDLIKEAFLKAYNELMSNKDLVIEDMKLMKACLTDFTKLDSDIVRLTEEVEMVEKLVSALVNQNAKTLQSQEEYLKSYDSLSKRYNDAKSKLEKLILEKEMRKAKDIAMQLYIDNLIKQPLILNEWDDTIWHTMVEKGIVHKDESITFVFYNGTEIDVLL
jgi:site-specific DNA recombinase